MTEHKSSPSTAMSSGAGTHSLISRSKPLKADHGLMSLPTYMPSTPRFSSSGTSSGSIKFYNRDESYYEFTNFYRASVYIDGQRWPTTEHYFQAQKFVGTPYVEVIRRLPTAREAFKLSRDPKVSRWRRSDWDTVKDDIMLKALRCKFTQHQSLREMLWKTGDKELIEHTANDSYWADGGGKGKGMNKLGKLLMKVRDEIVEVRGSYKQSSGRTFGLKRWSSSSDLSTGHTAKKSNAKQESGELLSAKLQGTTLGSSKKKPRLRRSASLSRIPNPSGNCTDVSRSHSKSPKLTSVNCSALSPCTRESPVWLQSQSQSQHKTTSCLRTPSLLSSTSNKHSFYGARHSPQSTSVPVKLNPISWQPMRYQ